MHMSDALITPIVGGAMILTSAGLIGHASSKIEKDLNASKLPLMGVLGAFVFAAQMINFAIPGTGSSGHIGGGILLAILLGPYAGFLTLAAVLFIQALFFADGGFLAFGCNVFNLGFFTCFLAYPLIFKSITKKYSRRRVFVATIIASVVGLQLGSFGVVMQTYLSNRVALDFIQFIWFMQPIHLAIGLIEGILTGLIVVFLYEKNPQMIESKQTVSRRWLIVIVIITLLIGSGLSLLASSYPDGLEWSLEQSAEHLEGEGGFLAQLQNKLAFLPDYGFKNKENGTSFSGVIGSLITLIIVLVLGFVLQRSRKKKHENT